MTERGTFDVDRTFVTSDHHFGSWHSPLHVFTQEEEDELIAKWNAVVGRDDCVLYVGDFHDCGVAELMAYRKRLNGKVVLIKGNHDRLPDSVYAAVFESVHETLVLDELNLVLRHCPDEEIPEGIRHIYGHLHHCEVKPFLGKNTFCACVQWNDGFPVPLRQAISQMQTFDTEKERIER